jgi:hypothetical protein
MSSPQHPDASYVTSLGSKSFKPISLASMMVIFRIFEAKTRDICLFSCTRQIFPAFVNVKSNLKKKEIFRKGHRII